MAPSGKLVAAVLLAILAIPWTDAAAAEPSQVALPAKPPADAIDLFDGKATDLFVSAAGDATDWRVEDGALVSTPNGRRSNSLVSRLHFRDAEIHVEFMLPQAGDGNSGVYVHGLYEVQILNSAGKREPGLGDMGAVYGLYRPLVNAARPAGAWQAYDVRYRAPRRDAGGAIVADGLMTAWLNGRKIHDRVRVGAKTSDYNPYEYDVTPYLAAVQKRQLQSTAGPLLLQDHDCPVRFRNIWVKPLDDLSLMYDPSAKEHAHGDLENK
jgi:hypothetical protein